MALTAPQSTLWTQPMETVPDPIERFPAGLRSSHIVLPSQEMPKSFGRNGSSFGDLFRGPEIQVV
jgi:hypothetical protein